MYWNQSAADLLYTGLLLALQDKSVRSTNGPRFVGVLNRGKEGRRDKTRCTLLRKIDDVDLERNWTSI
jgi:hypothetical protein